MILDMIFDDSCHLGGAGCVRQNAQKVKTLNATCHPDRAQRVEG